MLVGSKADFLLDFLRYNKPEYLYLVADIIGGWQLRRSWYWAHNDIIQKVLRKARQGRERMSPSLPEAMMSLPVR